jgi:serine protease
MRNNILGAATSEGSNRRVIGAHTMKRIGISLFLFMLCSTAAFAQNTYQHYIVGTRVAPREVADDVLSELPARAWRSRTSPLHTFRSVDAFEADLTWDEAQALKKRPDVTYVEEDQERHALADSVTPGAETTPYGISMVNAPQVWPLTKGKGVGTGVATHVVIIDTGIDYNLPDLAAAYRGGFNTLTGTNDPLDDNGHGTHVAGTIAAAANNDGVVGVAPDAAVYSVKVLDACGSGATSKIITAVDWVIGRKNAEGGNWIMSLSLGASGSSTGEAAAFQRANDNGILTFAASGNSYPTTGLAFPAAYPSVVSVGAVDSAKTVAIFSQRGADLKVVAPGVSVLSTYADFSELYNVADATGISVDAYKIEGSDTNGTTTTCATLPPASGRIVSCGVGNKSEFPASVAGNIALIQRGGTSTVTGTTLSFAEKARNAKTAGAVGVIVYNNRATENPNESTGWSMSNLASASEVPRTVVGITQADGAKLLTAAGTSTVKFVRTNADVGYTNLSGTSMATPHASAVGALVWAVAPGATNEQVKQAILSTTQDLGDPGRDDTYGNGLVDAFAAAKAINPTAFSNPAQPPPTTTPSGRRSLRRGNG